MSELEKKTGDSIALEGKQPFHCKLFGRGKQFGFLVSVLYKCKTLREESGDDKLLLHGSATDCIDAEAVLEVHPKEEWLASHFHTNSLFQPAFSPFSLPFLSLSSPPPPHSETCRGQRSIREFL